MRLNEFIQEGVHDPAIFKVVFIIGGPGSGKSFISKKLGLSALGYTTINSDVAFEYLMRKHKIDQKMPPEEQEKRDIIRQRAKDITADKSSLAIEGRLGLIIDGTGDDFEKISKLKQNFDGLGYNNFLVVVNTKLDVARQRNHQRERTVPDKIVVDSWYAVKNNIGKFAQIFENVSIIDNSGDGPATEQQIQNTYKKLVRFSNQQPNKPQAKKWIEQQSVTTEASYKGNIGAMEVIKFKQLVDAGKVSIKLWTLFKQLIANQKQDEAWLLLQKVTNTELIEAEKNTIASNEIYSALQNNGYKLLGSGQDATVWAKKEGPVIKIIMPNDGQGAGPAGDTFMKFYNFCKEHQGYDNLPKFSGNEVDMFEADGKNYIMVTMERLKPIPRKSFEEAIVWMFSHLATKRLSWGQALNLLKDEKTWQYFDEGMDLEQVLINIDNLSRKQLLEYEVLFKLMTLLYHRGNINKIGWDLHTENVMMRDNTLVITDPWFNFQTKS